MEKVKAVRIELSRPGETRVLDGNVWEEANKTMRQWATYRGDLRVRFLVVFADGQHYEGHCYSTFESCLETLLLRRFEAFRTDREFGAATRKFLDSYEIPVKL